MADQTYLREMYMHNVFSPGSDPQMTKIIR